MKGLKDVMMKNDTIVKIGKGSLIQHGRQSDRVYLMKLHPQDAVGITVKLIYLARQEGYSKIFCKIPQQVFPLFLAEGFLIEGYIPGCYNGKEDAFFVSKFMHPVRQTIESLPALEHLQCILCMENGAPPPKVDADEYSFRQLNPDDAQAIVGIYTAVFESYPFPIHNPDYIVETMNSHVQYFGAFRGEELAGVASCEIDFEARNAEMTDFATHHSHAGHHLACRLLEVMEQEMHRQGILTLYTIARLNSIPMNKTFVRMGYKYSGTLINNTQIAGGIETMNVYYKSLSIGFPLNLPSE